MLQVYILVGVALAGVGEPPTPEADLDPKASIKIGSFYKPDAYVTKSADDIAAPNAGSDRSMESHTDDHTAALSNLARGGDTTRQAVNELLASSKELIESGFHSPFLAARVLHMLQPDNQNPPLGSICSETRTLLLRLLTLLPLKSENDRHQAMRLAQCDENWDTLVLRHHMEFPQAAGVIRVAHCNTELRTRLIQAHFDKQIHWRTLWEKSVETVDEYIGQQYAQNIVFPKLHEVMFRRRTSDSPLSFLFVGPSGTGKTELARRIASMLHNAAIEELNADGRFVEFKMGNYATEEQFTQWIGVPDGVKGGDGLLAQALQKHPNAVIYLDEIEKARPSAGDRLLAFLDAYGTLQVSKTGQHVKTNKATWILSSNLAAKDTINAWRNHLTKDGDVDNYSAACSSVEEAIKKPLAESEMFRRPELRHRLSAVVPFTPFRLEEVGQIVQLQLQKLRRKYAESPGYEHAHINWTPQVVDYFTGTNREETINNGNVRELIKSVEGAVNAALIHALDCDERLCDALAPKGHTCSLTTSDGHFLVDVQVTSVQAPHVVVRYLPATIEEAIRACSQHPNVNGNAIVYGSTISPASFDGQRSSTSTGSTDGGVDYDDDVAWNYLMHRWTEFVHIMDENWAVLRLPTFATTGMVIVMSYGFLYAIPAIGLFFALEWGFTWARWVWDQLPEPMRAAIRMGVRQFGGLVVKHWDVSLIIVAFACALWIKNLILGCCGRRRFRMAEDEEEKNRRLVKLILTTLEARDKRMVEFTVDAIEKRMGRVKSPSEPVVARADQALERFEKKEEGGANPVALRARVRTMGAPEAATAISRAWRAHRRRQSTFGAWSVY